MVVRRYTGGVNNRADAVRAFWYVSFIWSRNIGGITVQRALNLLRLAEANVQPGDGIYRQIKTLRDDIIHNSMDPVEFENIVNG